jgi:hypothetical protein
MEILVRIISSNYIIFRTPTILMCKLGVPIMMRASIRGTEVDAVEEILNTLVLTK